MKDMKSKTPANKVNTGNHNNRLKSTVALKYANLQQQIENISDIAQLSNLNIDDKQLIKALSDVDCRNKSEDIVVNNIKNQLCKDTYKKVSTIFLNYNLITDEGLKRILQHTRSFENINHLYLNSNRISDLGLQSLIVQSLSYPNGIHISLENNKITGSGILDALNIIYRSFPFDSFITSRLTLNLCNNEDMKFSYLIKFLNLIQDMCDLNEIDIENINLKLKISPEFLVEHVLNESADSIITKPLFKKIIPDWDQEIFDPIQKARYLSKVNNEKFEPPTLKDFATTACGKYFFEEKITMNDIQIHKDFDVKKMVLDRISELKKSKNLSLPTPPSLVVDHDIGLEENDQSHSSTCCKQSLKSSAELMQKFSLFGSSPSSKHNSLEDMPPAAYAPIQKTEEEIDNVSEPPIISQNCGK